MNLKNKALCVVMILLNLKNIKAQENRKAALAKAAPSLEAQERAFEKRVGQGAFFTPYNYGAETITVTVKDKQYEIFQLKTIGQSKVTGKRDDRSSFCQAVKNAAAVIDFRLNLDFSALAPLVSLPDARAKLEEITRLLDQTVFPSGSRTHAELKDDSGFCQDVSFEEGSALFHQLQFRFPELLHSQIMMNKSFLDHFRSGRVNIQEGLQMLQDGTLFTLNPSSSFFDFYQISSNTLDAIDAWQNKGLDNLGIILQIERHFIAIVLNRHKDGAVSLTILDSIFGVNHLENRNFRDNLLVPLIDFVENFDIKPWFQQLSLMRDTEQLVEREGARSRQFEVNQALASFLADFNDDVNGDNSQRTPLVAAAENNDLPLVKLLIEAEADVNQQLSKDKSGHKGRDALFFAANWGRPEIVKVLLAAGADNFDDALAAAEGNEDIKASRAPGTERAGTFAEYQAVIDAIKAAKAKAANRLVAVARGGAAGGGAARGR